MKKRVSTVQWEVRPVFSAAAAGTLGVALIFFDFRNRETQEVQSFGFFGGGPGFGVKGVAGNLKWTQFTAQRDFGFWDLNGAGGRVSTAGVGFSGGYGLSIINAWTGQGDLFSNIQIKGFEFGTGAAAMVAHGVWKSI